MQCGTLSGRLRSDSPHAPIQKFNSCSKVTMQFSQNRYLLFIFAQFMDCPPVLTDCMRPDAAPVIAGPFASVKPGNPHAYAANGAYSA